MHYLLIGGSSGIGRALVDILLAEGHNLTIFSRQQRDLPATVTHYVGDILKDALPSIEAPLHGVVYLPGSIQLKPFHLTSEQQFRSEWELNFLGAVKALQAVYPLLRQGEGSSVVLLSTVAVQTGMPFHASIAAAKGAMEGLTRSLAAEWAPTIRVNAIAPSLTQTPLAEKLLNSPDKQTQAAQRHPLKRFGQPEDVAHLIAFLLSPQSRWMTGQVLHMDGGMQSLRLF
jgi:NAD(P)-dependent dehydrogenase (short-subunit alcohol dehydrogenase family)